MNQRDIDRISSDARGMWRLILIFSVIPIAAAMAARWWFGMKVLLENGGRPCRYDSTRWNPAPADGAVEPIGEGSAYELGRLLRLQALNEWSAEDPKGAKSRASSKRFGMAVPPISGIVAVMAFLVAKVPVMGALSAILAATAVSAALGILSLPAELAAITRAARKLREGRGFSRSDDEEAVIRCAMAHAWKDTLPPILGLIQK